MLLLIGLGPKIVLLPFVELTAALPEATKRRVVLKMLQGASGVAVVLLVLGGVLTKVLHFSPGALSIASGIILLIMSVPMVLGSGDSERDISRVEDADPMELAMFPLTIPYLVTPVGIVVLVTLSAESHSVAVYAVVVGLLALVLLIDVLVLLCASRVSKHLHKNRMQLLEHGPPRALDRVVGCWETHHGTLDSLREGVRKFENDRAAERVSDKATSLSAFCGVRHPRRYRARSAGLQVAADVMYP